IIVELNHNGGSVHERSRVRNVVAMNGECRKNKTIKDFRPSFTREIAPILSAIVRLERVHQHQMGPRARFHGSIGDLNFKALGGPGSLQANRDAVFERVRDPNTLPPTQQIQPSQMPSAYGDYFERANGRGGKTDPAYLHSVSKLQYALLRAWQQDDFVKDWDQVPASPSAITPVGLDRAALENMSGGAFYPGMEASWLFAKKEVWEKPFRLARNRTVGTIPVPGEGRRDVIVAAGVFSQQMALPWQADFLDCVADFVADQSVADKRRRVGWWPMTRPDEAFPLDSPKDRRPWARVADPQTPLGFRQIQTHNEMVNLWSTLGFVVETAPEGGPTDLYEVEFNKAPILVAAAAPRPAPGSKKAARKKSRATSKA